MSGEDLIASINSDALRMALFSTQFGHLWLIRLLIGLAFGINLCLPERKPGRSGAAVLSLTSLSLLELVSLAWAGHAVADSGSHGALHLLTPINHKIFL